MQSSSSSSRARRVDESAYPPAAVHATGYAASMSSQLPPGAAPQSMYPVSSSSSAGAQQYHQHYQPEAMPNTPSGRSFNTQPPSVMYRTSGSDEAAGGGDTTMSTSYHSGAAHSEAHLVGPSYNNTTNDNNYNDHSGTFDDYDQRRHARLPAQPQQALYSPPPAPMEDSHYSYGSPLMSEGMGTQNSRYTYTDDKLLERKQLNPPLMGESHCGAMDMSSDKQPRHGRRQTGGASAGAGHGANANAGADGGVSTLVKGYGTPHQIAFLLVVLLQTLASVAMIAIVWAKIRAGTPQSYEGLSSFFSGSDDETALRRRSITVYLAIFLFGSAFEIITAVDALRLNNTIQLIGVCMFVVAMMVYSALLDGQIENAISTTDGYSPDLYPSVRPYIIAMPIIQGVSVLVLAYFTYKLFRDFGWEVLHLIGADRKLKRMYTKYQIFVCLVKFDFFFFVGFSLQYMILVLKVQEAEFIITIIAFPFTILALVLAVIAVRRENRSLSYIIFVAELAALAYFVFKFFRLFQSSQAYRYQTSRKTLAVFSALAIVMLLSTFWVSVLCFRNYGNGLREAIPGYFGEHRANRRQRLARKNSQSAGAVLAEQLTRMSID